MNDIKTLKALIKELHDYFKEKLQLQSPVKIVIKHDPKNSLDPLGKTAYFDSVANAIVLYVTKRHVKDVLRSLAHELAHAWQRQNGKFDNLKDGDTEEGYAQSNEYLREIEKEAYMVGNINFRDFEDGKKKGN